MTSFLQVSLLQVQVQVQALVRRSKQTSLLLHRGSTTVVVPTTTTFRSFASGTTGGGGGGTTGSSSGRSNFDRDVLLPASRGELGMMSGFGIPKLAARRNKANLYADSNSGNSTQLHGGVAASLKYEDEEDYDEDYDIDPSNPFYDRHAPTMTMIANAYQPSSQYSNGSYSTGSSSSSSSINRDDGSEDTDQNYVLLNADIVSPSISDDGMNAAEQELEYLTHVMLDTARDVAELAILEATEQQQQQQQKQQDPNIIAQNEQRKKIILQKLQNTEFRILNDTKSFTNGGSSHRNNKYTTNGVLNSSLQYLETNLTNGIKYDGSPSMIYKPEECHTNPYLPHNKYFSGFESKKHPTTSVSASVSNQATTTGYTRMLPSGQNQYNGLEEQDLENDKELFDPNTPEAQMLQQAAIIAYAKALELDMDFGYWNEMDYDHLLGLDDDKTKSEMDELNEFAREDLKKKEAIAQLLQEAELESTADILDNDEEDLATLADGREGSGTIKNSSGGKGATNAAKPVLSAQEKESNDFVEWFGKKNSVLEYEYDPALMTATEIQNLSPMVRKKFQDLNINLNDTVDPNDIGDKRDEMYDGHPNMVELCSGSDEVIYVEAPHQHQLRRPKPTFRTNIKQPDELFLNQYRRFAYVNNLPPIYLEGNDSKLHPPKLIDISNPVDRTFFQRNVANMMNIDNIDQIYPASTTSAYIGYKDAIGLATTLMNGPNYEVVQQIEDKIPPPFFEALSSDHINHKFVTIANERMSDSDKCMLQLSNLDVSGGTRYTSISLAKALFSSSGNKEESSLDDIGVAAYGNVTADNIHFVNATTAIIQFASAEQASSVLDSEILRTRLRGLNSRLPNYMNSNLKSSRCNSMNQRLEVFRARRELVHRGWDTSRGQYRGTDEILKFGNRLIVDGDLPTKDFYISHAAVVMLTGVDPAVTSKLEVSNFVQPYCSLQRDVEGSIQWVECNYTEQRTDRVYVGFDLVGEAEAFVKAVGGTTNAFYKHKDKQRRATTVKLLRDRQPPNYAAPPLQRRPDRPIEEILKDMNNWEQYVDASDIEYLENHGISKHVLDEALRAIRYNNESFGTFDATLSTETLDPSAHQTPGQHYRDLVQLYVATLKECVATPENPGEIFTMLQFPNEEPDLGYFDHETKRLGRIKNERIGSGGVNS